MDLRVPSTDSRGASKQTLLSPGGRGTIARASTLNFEAEGHAHLLSPGGRGLVRASTLNFEAEGHAHLSPSHHEVPKSNPDLEQLLDILIERGRGSLLRGWRRELDESGDLQVTFQDFCRHALRLNFTGDIYAVFGQDDDLFMLDLGEIAPDLEALVIRFRYWSKDMFGGLAETFSAFDSTGRGSLTPASFLAACDRLGFEAEDKDLLMEIFHVLDENCQGEVTNDMFFWLEPDKELRELAAFNSRKNQKDKHLRLMAWAYAEDGRQDLPACHRRAQRPWLAANFADLPMLINQRRVEWQRLTYRKTLEARITFVRHLRKAYGNEIRAWRLGLDPECTFEIKDKDVRRYCRKADLQVDTVMLWKSLDKDCDGMFRLEELSVRAADILASFQDWAHETFGSCAAIWDLPEFVEARRKPQGEKRWMSQKKVLFSVMSGILRAVDCPFQEPHVRSILFGSLDAHGCGFISRADLEWLDMWNPPVWLRAEPDHDAWEELREMMIRVYKHPLKAWRNLLDADNSNNVSWVEFKQACEKLRFKGNIGGAWRVLNANLSSSISMKEYDAESADLLGSFKDWADTHYGSVRLAFKALEQDGRLTYVELRRACQKLKYRGEVRLLFDCLDTDGRLEGGKRYISLREVSFLDDWEGDPSPEEQAEDEIVNERLEEEAEKAEEMKYSSSLPVLSTRVIQLAQSKHRKADPDISATGSYVSREGSLISGPTRGSSASRVTKSSIQSEKLHRTYHILKQGRPKSGSASRQSAQVRSTTTAGSRPRSLGQKLPWLKKMLEIDDEMQSMGR